MEELVKDLLWYVFSRRNYSKTYTSDKLLATVGNSVITQNDGEGNTLSAVLLDKKAIIKISIDYDGYLQASEINFHGRYDFIIRSILSALDIELSKFGKSWVGYPHEAGEKYAYPSLSQNNHRPIEIRNKEIREEEERVELKRKREADRRALETTMLNNTWSTSVSSTHTYTDDNYLHTYSPNYPSASRAPTQGTTPSNPILAQAQQRGMTQRQIEQLAQRGRTR